MKKQMTFEKIICYVLLASCAICFIFALGITTNLYNAKVADGSVVFLEDGVTRIKGGVNSGIYENIQPFNKIFIRLTILMILLSVLQFITKTNSRRKYYISNYASIGLAVVGCIAISVWAIIQLLHWRNEFLTTINFERWKFFADNLSGVKYSESTFWFDISIITLIINIICCGLMVFNLVWKILLMRYENEVLTNVPVEGVQA